jgi:L-asparaginase
MSPIVAEVLKGRKNMAITIFTTGGTIDKVYFDAKGGYQVGAPMVRQILAAARASTEIAVIELLKKDSLEMSDVDRGAVYEAICRCESRQVIVTHGTDTMVDTGRALISVRDKTIVLTGALQPARFTDSDAPFNLGMAFAAVQTLPSGVYIAANGTVFEATRVRKNLEMNRFEPTG